ncbi:MAG TPA: SDR family oxidoreductase [Bryobacteraceae bacterium]|nr:SDR family oxidoreductase [Bryobacteraceae bacterium]
MRTILITGCSSGIGLATARHFARKGWKVFAGARTPATANELRDAASELGMAVVQVDVTSDESVGACVAQVLQRGGHVDALVNNAGIGGGGPLELASLARGHETFETNYFGAVRMMQAVLPSMRERKSGAIVNVTSLAGRVALAGHGHYAASKWALEAASECLASEVKPFGIRVATIEPGVVLTPIFSKSSTPLTEYGAYQAPVRRLWALFGKQLQKPTQPGDVAEAIEHAVETKEPKLRYLVGSDAKAVMAGRAKLTDEEWVVVQGVTDDEEYFAGMEKSIGGGLFR